MNAFHIDTGTGGSAGHIGQIDKRSIIMDAVLDGLPEFASQSQIDAALTLAVLGELRTPRSMKTVRRRLLTFWPLIAPLAEREPALFDQILTEFAETSTELAS